MSLSRWQKLNETMMAKVVLVADAAGIGAAACVASAAIVLLLIAAW
jgi:hypothetical protein